MINPERANGRYTYEVLDKGVVSMYFRGYTPCYISREFNKPLSLVESIIEAKLKELGRWF